jgi:ankyrin repeat protein
MALAEGIGPLDIARLIVSRGANVNAKSATGMTALMVAAVHDNPAMIGVLAQLRADPSAKEAGVTRRGSSLCSTATKPRRKFSMCSRPRQSSLIRWVGVAASASTHILIFWTTRSVDA